MVCFLRNVGLWNAAARLSTKEFDNRDFRFGIKAGQYATKSVDCAWDEILVASVAHHETRSPDVESADSPIRGTPLDGTSYKSRRRRSSSICGPSRELIQLFASATCVTQDGLTDPDAVPE